MICMELSDGKAETATRRIVSGGKQYDQLVYLGTRLRCASTSAQHVKAPVEAQGLVKDEEEEGRNLVAVGGGRRITATSACK
jgi:hypothetical protein